MPEADKRSAKGDTNGAEDAAAAVAPEAELDSVDLCCLWRFFTS